MRRRPDIKYTEMAMYVDAHIHEPNHDIEKIYDYLVMLSYMLAVKRRFFDQEQYYDKFANYFAQLTYLRIVKADKPQYATRKIDGKDVKIELHEGDKGWLTPIKSCLNYMKQVLYVKKCYFIADEFTYITAANDKKMSDAIKEYSITSIINSNRDLLVCDIDLYFKAIDKIIKNEIINGVYGNDKLMVWKLYTSCLLSLLRNLTLSTRNRNRLDKSLNRITFSDELLADIMSDETKLAPAVYGLSNEYIDYVAYLLQKIKAQIIKDIKELSREYTLSDDMIEDILMADFTPNEEI